MVELFCHKKESQISISNWRDYNQSLRERGSLPFWISEQLLDKRVEKEKTGECGASARYTEAAILAIASIKFFHQAGRQTCGLMASISADIAMTGGG